MNPRGQRTTSWELWGATFLGSCRVRCKGRPANKSKQQTGRVDIPLAVQWRPLYRHDRAIQSLLCTAVHLLFFHMDTGWQQYGGLDLLARSMKHVLSSYWKNLTCYHAASCPIQPMASNSLHYHRVDPQPGTCQKIPTSQ